MYFRFMIEMELIYLFALCFKYQYKLLLNIFCLIERNYDIIVSSHAYERFILFFNYFLSILDNIDNIDVRV